MYFRIDRDPAVFIGTDDKWIEQRLTTDLTLKREHVAHVHIGFISSLGGGVWAETRRDVRMDMDFHDFSNQDLIWRPDTHRIADGLRRESLALIRARNPRVAAWIPPAMEAAPIEDIVLSARAETNLVHWPGYIHNAISLTVLSGFVWAIWPRRKPIAPAPISSTPPATSS